MIDYARPGGSIGTQVSDDYLYGERVAQFKYRFSTSLIQMHRMKSRGYYNEMHQNANTQDKRCAC